MEHLFFLLIILPLLILPFFLFVSRASGKAAGRPPPGPRALPVIGSAHHLIGSLQLHRALRGLSCRHGPVMQLKVGTVATVVLSSPDAAREVLRTFDMSFAERPPLMSASRAQHPGHHGIIFAPYGGHWRQLRKVCTAELFSPTRVKQLRRVRDEEAASLVQSIAAASSSSGAVNVTEALRAVMNDITARAVLGDKYCGEREALFDAAGETFRLLARLEMVDLFASSSPFAGLLLAADRRRLDKCGRTLAEILGTIIRRHEETRISSGAENEDFIDVLLRIKNDDGAALDQETIEKLISELYSAGGESVSTVLVWAMAELARNPAVMRKAQSELREAFAMRGTVDEDDLGKMSYFQCVIKETLRRRNPTPLMPRRCREDCRILGYDVPKGTTVVINAWAIENDPSVWDDAEEFVPERFEEARASLGDFDMLPFGGGRRICVGMHFALASMEAVLARLLFHFDWELPPGMVPTDVDMAESLGVTLRKTNDLWLRPILRYPPPTL